MREDTDLVDVVPVARPSRSVPASYPAGFPVTDFSVEDNSAHAVEQFRIFPGKEGFWPAVELYSALLQQEPDDLAWDDRSVLVFHVDPDMDRCFLWDSEKSKWVGQGVRVWGGNPAYVVPETQWMKSPEIASAVDLLYWRKVVSPGETDSARAVIADNVGGKCAELLRSNKEIRLVIDGQGSLLIIDMDARRVQPRPTTLSAK